MHGSTGLIAAFSGLLALAVAGWPGCQAAAERAFPATDAGSAVAPAILAKEADSLVGASFYHIYLNGFLFGRATIEGKREGADFLLQAAADLQPILGNLYPVGFLGQSRLSGPAAQPSEVLLEEEKGAKKTTFRLSFPQPDHATAVQVEAKSGKETKRSRKEFFSESYILDPLSTIFLVRSRDWRVGDVQVFDIVTGKKQYQLQLTCRRETALTVEGELREAWEIVPQTRSYEKPYKTKLSGYVVYLAKDSRREILKVKGRHKLGRVVAQLARMDGQARE